MRRGRCRQIPALRSCVRWCPSCRFGRTIPTETTTSPSDADGGDGQELICSSAFLDLPDVRGSERGDDLGAQLRVPAGSPKWVRREDVQPGDPSKSVPSAPGQFQRLPLGFVTPMHGDVREAWVEGLDGDGAGCSYSPGPLPGDGTAASDALFSNRCRTSRSFSLQM